MKIIEQLRTFALDNPALLVVPAISFALSSVVVRIKTRYVNEGALFCWSPSERRESEGMREAEEGDTPMEKEHEDKSEFESSASLLNGGELITKLEKALDTNRDGKVTA